MAAVSKGIATQPSHGPSLPAPMRCPFETNIWQTFKTIPGTSASPGATASSDNTAVDLLPASYHRREDVGTSAYHRVVANPAIDVTEFIKSDLSLGGLENMRHLELAGARRPPTQLHIHVAMGRQIIPVDRMDLHLLWKNDGKFYIKPLPRYLLDPEFWEANLVATAMEYAHRVSRGFLYTYACLISSESDFFIANEKRLLPRNLSDDSPIKWDSWKAIAREVLVSYDPGRVHQRFLRSELRLSRINHIHRLTRWPPFKPYFGGWRNYSTLFRENLAWMVAATVFIALILTAMQVGLATDRLKDNGDFQRASFGFTVFAMVAPLGAFGLLILTTGYNLLFDSSWLRKNAFGEERKVEHPPIGGDQV
ncbi:hypothetical protein B0T16DRAFT_389001 [Cercophora newfieldiana]|uniref:Subtilisin-like serine protease n=1 Tax=Cercophora newfieldiana TaxID=92897 RepID=A0AA39YBF1_9PEZI|nr:hypothetical protein B0T16DRAFT_389001 [Cercophora newfieldiana]